MLTPTGLAAAGIALIALPIVLAALTGRRLPEDRAALRRGAQPRDRLIDGECAAVERTRGESADQPPAEWGFGEPRGLRSGKDRR
jgi:hypothetical protein